MREGVIYKIHNIVNSKVYIGSSLCYKHRKDNHLYLLRRNKHHNKFLQSSWNKYGGQNFKFEIIDSCIADNLRKKEQYHILSYKSSNNKFGYNLCTVAGTTEGLKCKEETKRKISEANKKAYKNGFSEEHIKKLKKANRHITPWNKGKTYKCIKPISKIIIQYDKDGKRIREWDTMAEAGRILNANAGNISKCCSKVIKTCKGFIFRIKDEYNLDYLPEEDVILANAPKTFNFKSNITRQKAVENGKRTGLIMKNRAKKVLQHDMEGNFVREWESGREASRRTGLYSSDIYKCCNGKSDTCNNYIWKFKT